MRTPRNPRFPGVYLSFSCPTPLRVWVKQRKPKNEREAQMLKELQEEQNVSSFTLVLPVQLRDDLFSRAKVEDRSAGSVARNALRAFLGTAPPGRKTEASHP
jgi:hypothetical protein